MKSAIIFLVFTLVLSMADPTELQPQGKQVSGKLEKLITGNQKNIKKTPKNPLLLQTAQ
uniref:Uncharacterized protein n=1 Tax=Haplochromis burtoni TaxID=8153 RepID=A0A3Q2WX01_HAPBU